MGKNYTYFNEGNIFKPSVHFGITYTFPHVCCRRGETSRYIKNVKIPKPNSSSRGKTIIYLNKSGPRFSKELVGTENKIK
jgi:hypothetical protein